MFNPTRNKRILLGVTGSIAVYKAVTLASRLSQALANVDVILTPSAIKFVTPLTFQSVTGRQAYTDVDLWGTDAHVLHVGLAHEADILVIAPVTANTIAKLAHGIADNLLTITALASKCTLILAPAMDGGMYSHAATVENIEVLRQRGVVVIDPLKGHLASGLSDIGRMVEPEDLEDIIRLEFAKTGPLAGRKVIVTAGGTQEAIDPVRVIANHSSGKQGFALARCALDYGAEVLLITAPTPLKTPFGAQRINVVTAEEMLTNVLDSIDGADVLLMAAAVADFRPKRTAENKLKKTSGIPRIQLEATPDILREVALQKSETGFPQVTVGFAAESQDLFNNAQAKLISKNLDMIVANDITAPDAGFSVDTNKVTIIFSDGKIEDLPLMSKGAVANALLNRVVELIS